MKILIISTSWHFKHSFVYNFSRALSKAKHEVILLHPFNKTKELIDYEKGIYFEDLYVRKKRMPLSHFAKDYEGLDVIIIENTDFFFYNDLTEDKPIAVYYHRDYMCAPYILDPDVLLYRFYETELHSLRKLFPGFINSKRIKKIELFWHAINPENFNLKMDKTLKGLVWAGLPKSLDFYVNYDSFLHQYYFWMKHLLKTMCESGIIDHYFDVSGSLELYKDTVAKSEFALIIMPFNAFETRRLYEAAYLGAIPVIYIQSDIARKTYELMGFKHYENCIMFREIEEVKNLQFLGVDIKNLLRENARELVLLRHTYEVRVQEFLNILNYKIKKKEHDYPELKDEKIKKLYDKYYFPYVDVGNPPELKKIHHGLTKAKRGFDYNINRAVSIMYDRLIKYLNKVKEGLN